MNIIICDDLYFDHTVIYSGELCFTPKGVSKHPIGVSSNTRHVEVLLNNPNHIIGVAVHLQVLAGP